MKKYILYGHGGSYNHGVEAITKSTINLLRQISPDCEILLSTHFPEQDKEFNLKADLFLERNLDGRTNSEVYKSTLDEITSDSVLIHVGGDNYCYNNWERYAEIHEKGIENGATSILWGCSIDGDRLSDELLKVLASHTLILAREKVTYDTLVSKGLENVCKVSDIAFSLSEEKTDIPFDNYIVVNVSPLVCRKNPEVERAVEELIHYILENTQLKIVLLPHVMAAVDNDYEQLKEYEDIDINRIKLVSDKLSASQYKYIIARARLCVAARTHVTIAAYSSEVPTIAIGYSTKARGIGQDLNLEEYVIGVEEDGFQRRLLDAFVALMSNEDRIRTMLKTVMPDYKKNVISDEIIKILLGE